MDQKRYVQHISGQGEKWKVEDETVKTWRVESPRTELCNWDLPKSEYRLCDPPERWEYIDPSYVKVEVMDKDGFILRGQYRVKLTCLERKVEE